MRRSKNAQNRMAVKQPEKFHRLMDHHRFVDVTKAVGGCQGGDKKSLE